MKSQQYKYRTLEWHQVLNGYSMGIFPMGEDEGSIAWYEASPRAIMPIELPSSQMKISRSLKQVINKGKFRITVNKAFDEVIKNCAARDTTWINELIINAFKDLHNRGFAHSIEAWDRDTGNLAGGLYGVAYKGAFFGESMFRTVSNASKICVVKLYEILKQNNFILLDIQMMTNHFEQFGAIEVSKRGYLEILDRAMSVKREIVI